MPALYHDRIRLLSAGDVERVYGRTDALKLHRDGVVVPLMAWLENLPRRLMEMGLSRTPRRSGGEA